MFDYSIEFSKKSKTPSTKFNPLKLLKQYPLSILCTIAITYLSLRSLSNLPKISVDNFDKIAHFIAYFGYMAIILFENRRTKNTNLRFLLLSGLFVFAYGLLMEVIQGTTPHRQFDLYDLAANTTGCLTALLFFTFTFKPLKN